MGLLVKFDPGSDGGPAFLLQSESTSKEVEYQN